jgi:hypothetical protein
MTTIHAPERGLIHSILDNDPVGVVHWLGCGADPNSRGLHGDTAISIVLRIFFFIKAADDGKEKEGELAKNREIFSRLRQSGAA